MLKLYYSVKFSSNIRPKDNAEFTILEIIVAWFDQQLEYTSKASPSNLPESVKFIDPHRKSLEKFLDDNLLDLI